jgi:hypothetical protein
MKLTQMLKEFFLSKYKRCQKCQKKKNVCKKDGKKKTTMKKIKIQ